MQIKNAHRIVIDKVLASFCINAKNNFQSTSVKVSKKKKNNI